MKNSKSFADGGLLYNLQLFDRTYCFYQTNDLSLLWPKTKQHITKGTTNMFKHHPNYPVITVYKHLQTDMYKRINMLQKQRNLKAYKVIKHNCCV
jgi:hypothetical protein